MLRDDTPILLPFHFLVDYDDDDGIDMNQAAADIGRFVIPFKCEVIQAQVVVTEVCAGATSTPVVDFDTRPTIGSDTSRGAADIAHLVLSTTAAGKIMYDQVAMGTVLEVGTEVVVQLTTRADADPSGGTGHILPQLLVVRIPETMANQADMTVTT